MSSSPLLARQTVKDDASREVHQSEVADLSTQRAAECDSEDVAGPSNRPLAFARRLTTPRKSLFNGILRAPDTPGTGQSVRFGKRLYDDGDESRMSSCTGHSGVSHASSAAVSPTDSTASVAIHERIEHSDSADIVEMSLMSIGRRGEQPRHPYSTLDTRTAIGNDSSSDSAGLPALEGYSNLEDESFGLEESEVAPIRTSHAKKRAPETDAVSEADNESGTKQATVCLDGDADDSMAWSPMTTNTQASDYKSAKSSTSPLPGMSSREDLSSPAYLSRSAPTSLIQGNAPSQAQLSLDELTTESLATASDDDVADSPSAHKARRRQTRMLRSGNDFDHDGTQLSGHRRSRADDTAAGSSSQQLQPSSASPARLAVYAPSSLVRSQTVPSFLSLSFSSESSGASASSRHAVKEIFKATDELDRAHFERSEALLRRVQSVEREAADLRHSRARDRAARDAHRTALEHVEGLIRKLKLQLAQRYPSKNTEEFDIVETIEGHLQASKRQQRMVPTATASDDQEMHGNTTLHSSEDSLEDKHDQSNSRDRLEVMIRDELERDFEAERCKLLRDHEEDLRKLWARIESNDVAGRDSIDITSQEAQPVTARSSLPAHGTTSDLTPAQAANRAANDSSDATTSHRHQQLLDLVQALEQKVQAESSRAQNSEDECARLKEELQVQWRFAERSRETETQLRAQVEELEVLIASLQEREQQRCDHFEAQPAATNAVDAQAAGSGREADAVSRLTVELAAMAEKVTRLEIEAGEHATLLSRRDSEVAELRKAKIALDAAHEKRLDELQHSASSIYTLTVSAAASATEDETASACMTALPCAPPQADNETATTISDHERVIHLEKKLREMERELGNRGLSIVKLRKAKERLEADNLNFSIALSAKQQEVSLIKRTRAPRGEGGETSLSSSLHRTGPRTGQARRDRAHALLQDITTTSSINAETTLQCTPLALRQKHAGVASNPTFAS